MESRERVGCGGVWAEDLLFDWYYCKIASSSVSVTGLHTFLTWAFVLPFWSPGVVVLPLPAPTVLPDARVLSWYLG